MKNYKLEKILNVYNKCADGAGGAARCVCVHGAAGTGKSSLLNELCDSLLKSGANVYFAVNKGGRIDFRGDGAFREVLRQLVRMYGDDKDRELIGFISSYVKGTLADDIEEQAVKPLEKDAIIRFLFDCTGADPLVLIIDDLDKTDTFTIDLVGNLLKTGLLQFIVFSHTDKLENDTLTDMLYRNTKMIEYVQLLQNAAISSDTSPSLQEDPDIVFPDEAMLVLMQQGNERHLARHHMNIAEKYYVQLDYDMACRTYSTALDVLERGKVFLTFGFDKDYAETELELLLRLGDVHLKNKQLETAAGYYRSALTVLPDDISDKRVLIYTKLAECYDRLGKPDARREQIMLAEAFFCILENRTQYFDLYAQYIPNYLSLLAELDEKVLFREKLKQAYAACGPDDLDLTGVLYCEEAYMCIQGGDFDQACKLLTDAQKIAQLRECDKLRDEATNSLAICYEQIDKTEESESLWNELISRSYDPVRVALAYVNTALMRYRTDTDLDKSIAYIKAGINLCTLAREFQTIENILANLEETPLCGIIKLE